MDASQLFDLWAPADSVWSPWAKPVLFADAGMPTGETPPELPRSVDEARSSLGADSATAFVIDLPGERSVELGLALARAGYRPVPLFNGAYHPGAIVSVQPVVDRLAAGARVLTPGGIRPDAPPAFLLDWNRDVPRVPPEPGHFDNRWLVFPQDFPSAAFLLSHGIRRVVLLQDRPPNGQPKNDLAHVLRRWQEAGIEIYFQDPLSGGPEALEVRRPYAFRSLFYRALAMVGLRRNSAGGFGSVIPMPSQSSGFG
jgi:hypothetical protein